MYRYYNNNPHNRFIDDCVVRSISLLTNREWADVYDELSDLASDKSLMFDSVEFVENYLDNRYPRECHYSKSVEEFAKEYPIGKYAVSTNGHLTAIINGDIIDSFDPSKKIMRCAWRIQ